MTHPTALTDPGPAPEPSHRLHIVITVLGLVLWAGLVLGSRTLAPLLAQGVDAAEVALGLDVSRGNGEP